MSVYINSVSQFRKIAPGLKIFLIVYIVFMLILPIDQLLSVNIQKKVVNGFDDITNSNIRRIVVGIIMGYAFLINDAMLVGLLVFFAYHNRKK